MTFDPDSFFRSARSIGLTPDEFDGIKKNLRKSVTNAHEARHDSTMDQTKFLKSAKELSLRTEEKVQIRAAIMESIASASPSTSLFRRLLRIGSGVMAVTMIFGLCGASASYAAESALPGDALYTVKVKFTESILIRLNNSVEAKANVQARLVNRRLEEAKKLAEQSRFTAERVAIVQANLSAHISELEVDLKELKALNDSAATNIAIETSATVKAHESLLQKIVSKEDQSPLKNFLGTTERIAQVVRHTGIDESSPDVARKAIQKAKDEISRVRSHEGLETNSDVSDAIVGAEAALDESTELVPCEQHNAESRDDTDTQATRQRCEKRKMDQAISALAKGKEATLFLTIPPRSHGKRDAVQPPAESFRLQERHEEKTSGFVTQPPFSQRQEREQVAPSSTSTSATSSSVSSSMPSMHDDESSNRKGEATEKPRRHEPTTDDTSARETLKKTDDLIQKTLPRD